MSRDIKFKISADDNTKSAFASTRAEMDKTEARTAALKKSMVVAGAAIAGAVIGIGAAALSVGRDYDKASSAIVKGTGATGDALGELLQSFRAVNRMVPDSSSIVASAIADVNTRMGVYGQELEKTTKLLLDFSRVTDTDASTAINTMGKLFNALEIEAGDAEATLDKFVFASQATGISVMDLANNIIDAGPAFEELGFGLDEAIALFGQFEAAGAKPSEVVSSLGMVMNNFARQGLTNAGEAWDALMASIIDAPDILTATEIALDAGLGRVASKVAEDMRAGRFDIQAFVEELQTVDGALEKTADASLTLGDKWAILLKQVNDLLVPIGERMVDAMERAMDVVDQLFESGSDLRLELRRLGEEVRDRLDPVIRFLTASWEYLKILWVSLQPMVAALRVHLGALWAQIQELWRQIELDLLPALRELWEVIKPVLIPVLKVLATLVGVVIVAAIGVLIVAAQILVTALSEIVKILVTITKVTKRVWEEVVGYFSWAKDNISEAVFGIIKATVDPFNALGDDIWGKIKGAWDYVVGKVKSLANISLPSISLPSIPGFGGGRAMGGPVAGGTPYLVGEQGPELFVPHASGSIVPNHEMGGGGLSIGQVTINTPMDFDFFKRELSMAVS